MSIEAMIQVGTSTAQAAIDTAARAGDDGDVAAFRTDLLEFLRVRASQATANGNTELLDAYRGWLDVAVNFYGTGDPAKIREYVHRGAALSAELGLVAAGISGSAELTEG